MKTLIQAALRSLGYVVCRTETFEGLAANSVGSQTDRCLGALRQAGFAPGHIIDVGANHGKWTERALRYFPEARFTLIEPQEHLRKEIDHLLRAGHRIEWLSCGVGDEPGELGLSVFEDDTSCSFNATPEQAAVWGFKQVPVPMRTLDDIVAASSAPHPALVKIDAEGFDLKALRGARTLLGRTEVFFVEAAICAPLMENSARDLINWMHDAGYRLIDITDLTRSQRHDLLWLAEFVFLRRDSTLLNSCTSYK